MRNRIIVMGGLVLIAYVLGTRAARVQVKNRESVGHQLVRLWDDPKARRRRRKAAGRAEKKAKKALREFRR
ncbi:hypothetical protein [Microbacterium sp. RURRCA19A]|uniref:hypothetical protein n=1 Tax=Microbacterium sp. RURRCA19A TaxID=1907391 RepID=UPI0009550FDA|nr:hypothetical protein [Microbacterium sp. RURRCA19A]SIR76652.1 hypothetical protein SAMN05880568_1369 [Microbacterium sp. RURRCA19A]